MRAVVDAQPREPSGGRRDRRVRDHEAERRRRRAAAFRHEFVLAEHEHRALPGAQQPEKHVLVSTIGTGHAHVWFRP